MLVNEIMTKEVISITKKSKIIEISQVLTAYGIHGVPVVNENNIIEGIVTESDFFVKDIPNLYLPTYLHFLDRPEFTNNMAEDEKEKIKKLTEATANEIMTRECTTVYEDIDTRELINVFKQSHFYTIPVVSRERKIVGIVTLADVIKLVK